MKTPELDLALRTLDYIRRTTSVIPLKELIGEAPPRSRSAHMIVEKFQWAASNAYHEIRRRIGEE